MIFANVQQSSSEGEQRTRSGAQLTRIREPILSPLSEDSKSIVLALAESDTFFSLKILSELLAAGHSVRSSKEKQT